MISIWNMLGVLAAMVLGYDLGKDKSGIIPCIAMIVFFIVGYNV